jgi:ribosomal protein L24E
MTRYREVNEMPRCGSCGKLITAGGTTAERAGHNLWFCSENCIRIFDTYTFPKYGEAAVWPEAEVR